MCQGEVTEAEETSGGKGAEEHDGGLPVLQYTFGGGVRIQIPWEGADSFG